MGNGNTSGLVDGTEKSASSSECDVGLALRMQRTESFPSSKTMMMATPHHPHLYHHHPSESMGGVGVGLGGDGVSGPMYYNLSNNQLACLSDIYDVVGGGSVSGGAVVVPRTLHPFATHSSKSSGGGGMAAPAEVVFTASQRQELERQSTIYKYMMASIPVPPELLLPFSKAPSPFPSSYSQSNITGLDLKFSRSSDPEPWRCRRTDGKKWRCSRDVAPYQKYCERHAHKTRPRSRKPVELQSHNHTKINTTTTTHPLVNLPTNKSAHAFQKPIFHIPTPTLLSGATHSQMPRCTEWFMKGDPILGGNLNQEWQQQLMQQSSSRERLKSCDKEHNRNVTVFQQHYGEEQRESINTNSYIDMDDSQRLQNQQPNELCSSLLGPNQTQTTTITTTRHFIDAWSSAAARREEMDETSNKCSVPSSRNLPLSSLTLSMSGSNGIDEKSSNAQMSGLGMMALDRETGEGFKSQWLNPVPWMGEGGSPPGGPLGEALCLGISNTAKAVASNVPSPHGYNTTAATTNCSKISCENSGYGLHFH